MPAVANPVRSQNAKRRPVQGAEPRFKQATVPFGLTTETCGETETARGILFGLGMLIKSMLVGSSTGAVSP